MRSAAKQLTFGFVVLGAALIASAALALEFGASSFSLLRWLGGERDAAANVVLWQLRLPRLAASALVGAALGGAGALFQALLRNPLADPFILGISGGAAAGAVIAITLGATAVFSPPAAAFAGALLAMAVVYGASRKQGAVQSETLLLVGVIANAFFSAVILFLLAVSDPTAVVKANHWMMGHLGGAGVREIWMLTPLVAAGGALVLADANRVHLLQLGAETAWHLGVDVKRIERRIYFAACLLTAGAVAAAGMIGFVGLIVPHVVRRLFTSDFRILFPLSLVGGAVLVILSDTLARTILAPAELPVGVLTALLGAPFFFVLLRRRLG